MVRNNGIPWWGDKLHVTVSIGATAVEDNDTVGSMVIREERALEQGTQAGGNCVMVSKR
jgi:GGDEF domain-containing protein